MHPARAEVRFATVLADLGLEALVLAATDIGEPLAVRSLGRPGIEVDRQVEASGDVLPERPRQVDDVVHRRRPEWDERDDVDRPDARVLALVHVHVDLVDRHRDQPLESVADRAVLAGHREDRSVVAGVARPVEQEDVRGRGDSVGQAVDHVQASALRHVRDRLDEHGSVRLEHRHPDATLAGHLDRPVVSGVDVTKDAHRRIGGQDSLQLLGRQRRPVRDYDHPGVL